MSIQATLEKAERAQAILREKKDEILEQIRSKKREINGLIMEIRGTRHAVESMIQNKRRHYNEMAAAKTQVKDMEKKGDLSIKEKVLLRLARKKIGIEYQAYVTLKKDIGGLQASIDLLIKKMAGFKAEKESLKALLNDPQKLAQITPEVK